MPLAMLDVSTMSECFCLGPFWSRADRPQMRNMGENKPREAEQSYRAKDENVLLRNRRLSRLSAASRPRKNTKRVKMQGHQLLQRPQHKNIRSRYVIGPAGQRWDMITGLCQFHSYSLLPPQTLTVKQSKRLPVIIQWMLHRHGCKST